MSGLSETVNAILAELPLSDDGTGHIVDCGWDDDEIGNCGCYTLRSRIAAHVKAREAADAGRVADAVRAVADEWQAELDSGAIQDENARYCWALATREVRAALDAAPSDAALRVGSQP